MLFLVSATVKEMLSVNIVVKKQKNGDTPN